MDFLSLFWISLQPVLKLMILALLGALMASSKLDSLPPVARVSLSKLSFYLFTPALVFVTAAETFRPEALTTLWLFPVSCLINMLYGGIFGLLVVRVCATKKAYKWIVVAACTVGNYGALPIVAVTGLCRDPNSPFWGRDKCELEGVGYVSSGFWVGSIAIWLVAYPLMRPAEAKKPTVAPTTMISAAEVQLSDDGDDSEMITLEDENEGENEGLVNNESRDSVEMNAMPARSTGSSDQLLRKRKRSSPREEIEPIRARPAKFAKFKSVASWIFSRLLPPPIIATLIAVLVGSVPALRDSMFGEAPPLKVVVDILDILSGAMVPCIMLVLGGSLAKGPSNCELNKKTLVGICVVRLVILPALGLGTIVALGKAGALPDDKLFKFSLLLNNTVPTAANIGAVSTLHSYADLEVSVAMFWQYLSCCVAMAVWFLIFLYLLEVGIL